jgi:hypothetical protein
LLISAAEKGTQTMSTSNGDNPYEAGESSGPAGEGGPEPEGLTGRQAYNVVSDTVTGANVRLSDNLLQAAIIGVFLILGAGIGALMVEVRIMGAMIGGVVGLIAGLIGSGIFLMIYRAVMHMRGRHD